MKTLVLALFWLVSISVFRPVAAQETVYIQIEARPTLAQAEAREQGIGGNNDWAIVLPLGRPKPAFPMPAGGLFSTAHDMARFYQLLLNGGELDGTRYLSEAAVKQLTNRQTGLRSLIGSKGMFPTSRFMASRWLPP